jgi:uncharacterized HAD superfamily protein
MKQVQSTLTASNIIYGAVYGSDKAMAEGAINIRGYHLPDINHTFAWNLMRDCMTRHILTDMDGVVCEDWGKPDTGEWLARYEDFLDNAAPLKKPWKSPLAIVTARLEKYRRKTEVWLRKHQIPCKQLIMAPYATVEERQKNDGFAGRKAQIYLEMKDRARLFIESCPRQSRIIAERTKMPVLSFTEHRLYNGVEPQPAW